MFPVIDWKLCSLELTMTGILLALVVVDILLPKDTRRDWIGILSFVGLIGLLIEWLTLRGLTGTTFSGMFIQDSFAWFFKGFFLVTMVFVFAMTQQFFKSMAVRKNEFYLLLWLALLGMCFIASAGDFLAMFIALEVLTVALYVMTAYLKSDRHSLEAGMKYLILGALTSGFFLFGISFIYGVAHSTRFESVTAFAHSHPMSPLLLFGLVLVFAAVGFKIAAFPFQLWVPDVYQGAPAPVTALLSVGSKAAGFVILIRLFMGVFAAWHVSWTILFALLAAATMCYGNLGALFQTNMKRLLGYSSIAHAGYLLMGLAAWSALGLAAVNFYLLAYLFTNITAFFVIILFVIAAQSAEIPDYAGLAGRSGFLACALVLALASLAGIPPLAGFFGKFVLLLAVIKSGLIWLAVVAGVNIVISVYYYLRVAKTIYADAPREGASLIAVSPPIRWILGLAMAGIVVIGLVPGPFYHAAMTAVRGMSFLTLHF